MRQIEKQVLLQTIDGKWREHLLRLEHLRSVVGFRGYAQRDPKIEYQREGFGLFEEMNQRVDSHVSEILFKFELPDPVQERRAPAPPAAAGGTAERRPGLPRPPAGSRPEGPAGGGGGLPRQRRSRSAQAGAQTVHETARACVLCARAVATVLVR